MSSNKTIFVKIYIKIILFLLFRWKTINFFFENELNCILQIVLGLGHVDTDKIDL